MILDNGPESSGTALDARAVQNAFIESLNGKLRDECLNARWLLTLREAWLVIEAWRREHNEERKHSTIREMPPMEFTHDHQDRARIAQESPSLAVV